MFLFAPIDINGNEYSIEALQLKPPLHMNSSSASNYSV